MQLERYSILLIRYPSHPCFAFSFFFTTNTIKHNIEPMLVMEYMEYGSLHELLRNETMVLSGDLIMQITRDVSSRGVDVVDDLFSVQACTYSNTPLQTCSLLRVCDTCIARSRRFSMAT